MENDYLWDKTGKDEEIEQMENALRTFRYQPILPPLLPAKVLQINEKPKFSLFPRSFGWAFAGLAVLLVTFVSIGIWEQISNDKVEINPDFSYSLVTPAKIDFAEPLDVKTFNPSARFKEKNQQKPALIQKQTNIVFHPKVKSPRSVQLTNEEKEAYDQLILALSITGSKLKEVQDKVNGTGEVMAKTNSLK